MRIFVLTSIAAGMMAAMPAFAGEQTVSIDVSDMTCPSCSFTVATSMKSVASVEIVDFRESETFGGGVFIVSYDDAVASPNMIVEAVMAIGYPARILTDGES